MSNAKVNENKFSVGEKKITTEVLKSDTHCTDVPIIIIATIIGSF